MVNKIAFIYLTAFSKTGGIEQFNKNIMAALHLSDTPVQAISVYDAFTDERYFPANTFKGFKGNRILFLLSLIFNARKHDTLLIGHINLALAAFIVKCINPSVKLILVAHGIEVWSTQQGMKAWLLKNVAAIFSVSHFTKSQLIASNPFVKVGQVSILPNSLDPYFNYPVQFNKPAYLLNRYGLQETDKIILTIARLSSKEQYKGYDQVINAMKSMRSSNPDVKYILAGKADDAEFIRVQQLIENQQVHDQVILAGFIPQDELTDHYLLADVFALPSKGEGFGIVLIEALACGQKVIAGNKDGSVDALLNGELGTLIDPENPAALRDALETALKNDDHDPLQTQVKMKQYFAFSIFSHQLSNFLNRL